MSKLTLYICTTYAGLGRMYAYIEALNESVRVVINDRMQSSYVYFLTERVGANFNPGFEPEITLQQMLELGVFGGRYMTDYRAELPHDWFENVRLRPSIHDARLNIFCVKASQPLSEWQNKGGIYGEDPRG